MNTEVHRSDMSHIRQARGAGLDSTLRSAEYQAHAEVGRQDGWDWVGAERTSMGTLSEEEWLGNMRFDM